MSLRMFFHEGKKRWPSALFLDKFIKILESNKTEHVLDALIVIHAMFYLLSIHL